jgi:non-specific protein-tyrosine kinase
MGMSKIKKALEKAKQDRNLVEGQGIRGAGGLATPSVPEEDARSLECTGINPTYCQTKIVNVDPKVLKKNKILSYFHENGISDQIKILRTQVLDRMKEIGGNRLLVTSASPMEGKTLIAINLAVSISQELDRTVLFVETDMRTSSLHRYFGLEMKKGLADYLVGEAEIPDILLNPGIEKLVLLSGGRSLPLSAELLGAPRMQSLVREMRERYPERFIVFDGASLLSYADPLIFSRFIDGILLVVEAEKTSRQDLRRSLELLRDKTLIGTVLNKAKG